MKSDWKNCILGDCLQIVKTSVMPKEQTMYSCFSLPAFDNSRTPEILDGKDIKSSKFVLTENTILFNKLNPKFRRIWNVHSLDQTINPIASTEFLPLKVNSNISQDFLYYYISSPSFTALMDGIKTGTSNSQQRIDWRLFLRQPIYLPPSHTQCKIARILTLIDDKIHLNQQINKNLEQQAQAIFKSWFVDFEPFNGEMPFDWTVSKLGDIASIKTNSFSPVKNPDAQLEHYSIPAYDEQKYPVFESAAGVKSNKYILSKNSVMISKLNPDTKRVWRPMCLSELAVSSTEFIIFEAFNPAYRDFVFSIIDSAAFSDWMCAHTTGSTNSRQRTTPSATLEFQVALPDEKTITDFCAIVTPMYDAIAANICEDQKLAQLRDSILPKLMSGELDVSDINL